MALTTTLLPCDPTSYLPALPLHLHACILHSPRMDRSVVDFWGSRRAYAIRLRALCQRDAVSRLHVVGRPAGVGELERAVAAVRCIYLLRRCVPAGEGTSYS